MTYILFANISLLLFLGIYYTFLRRLTFFQENRIFLLSALIGSFILPLLHFLDLSSHQEYYSGIQTMSLPVIEITQGNEISPNHPSKTLPYDTLWTIYFIGCFVFFIKLISKLSKVRKTFKNAPLRNVSFSFFNRVYIHDQADYRSDLIRKHEAVHVRQRHSLDLLLVEIIQVFNWFNPFLGLYKKELKFQHECIADQICAADNKNQYAKLLVANAMNVQLNSIFNEFSNKSLLKQRIMMLFKKKTKRVYYLFYALVLPVVGISGGYALATNTSLKMSLDNSRAYIMSTADQSPEEKGVNNQKMDLESKNEFPNQKIEKDTVKKDTVKKDNVLKEKAEDKVRYVYVVDDTVFTDTEILPEPQQGMTAFRQWITENYNFPDSALNNSVSGRIEVSFVVEKDGTLSNVKIIRTLLGHRASNELVRLIKESGKWKPAIQNGRKVRFNYILPLDINIQRMQIEEKTLLNKAPSTTVIESQSPILKEGDKTKEDENSAEKKPLQPRITLKVKN